MPTDNHEAALQPSDNPDDYAQNKLFEAISRAEQAHNGQYDKSGLPYIHHPIAVMVACQKHGIDAMIAAVLHDVVEDTDALDLNDIDHYFGAKVVRAVDAVTRREGETYRAFIERAKNDPIGRLVKIEDIWHNLSPARREGLPKGLEFRYFEALAVLNG